MLVYQRVIAKGCVHFNSSDCSSPLIYQAIQSAVQSAVHSARQELQGKGLKPPIFFGSDDLLHFHFISYLNISLIFLLVPAVSSHFISCFQDLSPVPISQVLFSNHSEAFFKHFSPLFASPPLCTAPRGQVESLRQQLSTTQQQLLDSEAAAQAASVARYGASAMAGKPTRVTRVQEKCRKIGSILGCGRIFCPCCFGGMFTKWVWVKIRYPKIMDG